MREYLVEYGADGWRDYATVLVENVDDAVAMTLENYVEARWAIVRDKTELADDAIG